MAKKNGVFNKFLNMIGIVDADQDQQYRVYTVDGRNPSGGRIAYNRNPGYNGSYGREEYEESYSENGRARGEGRYQPYRKNTGTAQNQYGRTENSRGTARNGGNSGYGNFNVINGRSNRSENAGNGREYDAEANERTSSQTLIFYLTRLDQTKSIITHLINGKTVLINMEIIDVSMLQRAVDTLSGAAFAINASFQKASDRAYLISPTRVEVNGNNGNVRNFPRKQ